MTALASPGSYRPPMPPLPPPLPPQSQLKGTSNFAQPATTVVATSSTVSTPMKMITSEDTTFKGKINSTSSPTAIETYALVVRVMRLPTELTTLMTVRSFSWVALMTYATSLVLPLYDMTKKALSFAFFAFLGKLFESVSAVSRLCTISNIARCFMSFLAYLLGSVQACPACQQGKILGVPSIIFHFLEAS